jgi:ubiquinone/menaquinone biosynthesis C-methylase UbiE
MNRTTFAALLSLIIAVSSIARSQSQPAGSPVYENRSAHDPNGIGRFYFGREIARVMGHEGADWLERPDREETELPGRVVDEMQLEPASVVADVGAGTGYFTFRIATRVPKGRVYAVDIQKQMLAMIAERRKALKLENVVTVEGTERDTHLPQNTVDVVLLVDAYHEFAWPREMMTSIVRSLKESGRVVLIEYRGEDPSVPIKKVHKLTVAQAKLELAAVGLSLKETRTFLPYQHFMIFEKMQSSAR